MSIAQDCFYLISSVIKLINLWQNKDQYLESVKEFLNSIGDTIRKYQEDTSLKKKKQLAYEGLKKELTAFQDYLITNKNKNVVMRFFKGNNFISGCEDHITTLQQWMANMSLDLNLHFGDENAQNFKEIFAMLNRMEDSRNKSKCVFKDKFKNGNAAAFWIKYFENEQNVEWVDFLLNFKSFVHKTEKKELSEPVLEKIGKLLDVDGNKIVSYAEWDEFYEKIWSHFDSKADFLQKFGDENSKSPAQKGKNELLPPMTLIYLETNKEDKKWETKKKPHDFPLNHEFIIGPMGFNYQNIDLSLVEKDKDLVKMPLLLGRDNPKNTTFPDIAFSSHISTISRKQFHITAKNVLNEKGYYITDLSLVNPTAFRVRDKPYALNVGMLMDLNTYIFEVTEVFPLAIQDENQKDYIFMPTEGRVSADGIRDTLRQLKGKNYQEDEKDEDSDEDSDEGTRPRKKKAHQTNKECRPYLKIRIMNGFLPAKFDDEVKNDKFLSYKDIDERIVCRKEIEKQHETITLYGIHPDKFTLYSVGGTTDNDIMICDNDFEEYFCQFYYDNKKKGWFVCEKHPASHQKEFSSGTLIYLKHFQQYKENKIGSIGYKLRDGMEIFCNWHVFGVNLQEK